MPLTSAAGILALLDDPMGELKSFALRKLMSPYDPSGLTPQHPGSNPSAVIDVFWAEVSEAIATIEQLHEDSHEFKDWKLAGLVASKVYYHLGSYEDALLYALGAEELFDVNERSEYVDTMIARCIDTYTSKRQAAEAAARRTAEGIPTDPNAAAADPKTFEVDKKMENIVDKMFQRCFDDGEYKQALGIAVETHRLDMFKAAINKSKDKNAMLSYAFRVSMQLINNRHYRQDLLRCLVDLYRGLEKPDFVQMCQCLIYLDDPASVATVLESLSQGSEYDALMAYQIAFDMYESATQQFLNDVVQAIKRTAPIPDAASDEKKEETKKEKVEEEIKEEVMEVDDKEKENKKEEEKPDDPVSIVKAHIDKLTLILSGNKSIYLHLQFLMRNDHSDLQILKQTKDAVRVSVCHTATVIANGFMHCGTTHDSFLRDNLDWLSRATNWAKLSATASLGVIHRGHENESLALMQSYLPKDSTNSSGYAEGGGLYALGLIHANHGGEITEYLLNQVKEGGNEQIRSGGCLGLGLAAMGTHRADVYEQLRSQLYQDDAVTGEAAGIAMGLVELGSKSPQAIEDMVAYAQETQHEKILRGLAVGISMIMYGRLEEADPLIESLCNDKDAILHRSGMYTIAMAYCGTGSNKAIRKLLHVAVSDVNNDVRRAAVMGLGFLLFKNPEQCPGVVSLLSESYNPHVRYGAAMALGIACAGTGLKEAIALIEPMTNDPVNYVRQGALIASALILVQHTEFTCSKVKDFRALYAKVISDKHEDVMSKFGAILSQGIIDAGGRNATVSLQSRTGHTNMMAVVGMQVFVQYWYWFPLSHFLSLAFTPSCLIGLNENLDMPAINFRSNAKPSTYGYPPAMEEKKKEDREKVATAVLSITAKQQKKKRQQEQKEKEKQEGEKMEVDTEEGKEKKEEKKDETKKDDKMEEGQKEDASKKDETTKSEEEEKKPKEEPFFDTLANPARVMKPQLKVVQLEDTAVEKYNTIKEVTVGGIIMMQNTTGEKCDIVEPVAVQKAGATDLEDEPDPPEPFVFDDSQE